MKSWNIDYDAFLYNPELIKLCTNCKQKKCDGICFEYKKRFREVNGIREMRHIPKTERVKIRDDNGLYQAFGQKKTLDEWAQMFGIKYKTLYERLRRSGMTVEDALIKPLRKACIPKMYESGGKSMSIREWSEKTGIPMNTIYARLARGWTVAQAMGREKHGNSHHSANNDD